MILVEYGPYASLYFETLFDFCRNAETLVPELPDTVEDDESLEYLHVIGERKRIILAFYSSFIRRCDIVLEFYITPSSSACRLMLMRSVSQEHSL